MFHSLMLYSFLNRFLYDRDHFVRNEQYNLMVRKMAFLRKENIESYAVNEQFKSPDSNISCHQENHCGSFLQLFFPLMLFRIVSRWRKWFCTLYMYFYILLLSYDIQKAFHVFQNNLIIIAFLNNNIFFCITLLNTLRIR